jgi:hypothetical protein
MRIRALVLLSFVAINSAFSAEKDPATDLNGILVVQWIDDKRFIYAPDPTNPLRFRARDNREIKPGRMYTDGGSIPRLFWAVRGFSPWGYAPAYVVHDWLFHQHRCKRDNPPDQFTLEQANQALDDVVSILFRRKTVQPDEAARTMIKWAVDKFADEAWNEPCDVDPPLRLDQLFSLRTRITVERLAF